jgi:hypothetical protein
MALLHMVWKGIEGDSGIYHSSLADTVWAPQQVIPNVGTSHSPALAAFRNSLCMAWKGVDSDSGIYVAQTAEFNPDSWSAQQNVPGVGTSHGPALVAQEDQRLVMAWKGAGDDDAIYTSFNNLFHSLGGGWTPQFQVPNVGTRDKPALAVQAPKLFMAWKGIGTRRRGADDGIYFSRNSGDQNWEPQTRLTDPLTSRGPGLVFRSKLEVHISRRIWRNTLHLAWKGAGADSGIYVASASDGVNWTPQHNVPGVGTSTSPALAVFNGRLFMTWKGIEGDSGIYWSSSDDGLTWDAQQRVPGVGTTHGPALAVL